MSDQETMKQPHSFWVFAIEITQNAFNLYKEQIIKTDQKNITRNEETNCEMLEI